MRMPAVAQGHAVVRARDVELYQDRGHEAMVGSLFEDGFVERSQRVAGTPRSAADCSEGVAGEGGQGGRLRALAADVPDHGHPAIGARLEDVVEVAAGLLSLHAGAIPAARLELGDLRKLRG